MVMRYSPVGGLLLETREMSDEYRLHSLLLLWCSGRTTGQQLRIAEERGIDEEMRRRWSGRAESDKARWLDFSDWRCQSSTFHRISLVVPHLLL